MVKMKYLIFLIGLSFATMTQTYSEIVMVGMISYAHYLNELFCRIF